MTEHSSDLGAVDLRIPGYTDAVEVGRGGFGVVYRARQPDFDRTVAIKLLLAGALDDHARQRFDRERRIMGALSDHPNIVTVFGSGFTPAGQPYMAMAYMAKGSLADRLSRNGPLGWREAAQIGVKLSDALEAAHRANVLHRDIKPENVLVSAYGEPSLGDFGIARMQGGLQTTTGVVTASVAHAAPEVLSGQPPTVAGDVYSLGSTILTLLLGHPAFLRETDESMAPMLARISTEPVPDLRPQGVPDAMCRAIESAMAKAPSERTASAGEFGRQMGQALKGNDQGLRTVTPSPMAPTPTAPTEGGSGGRTAGKVIGAPAAILAGAMVVIILLTIAATNFLDDDEIDDVETGASLEEDGGETREHPPGSTMADIQQAGSITVGTRFDLPLFHEKDPRTNEVTGFDVEIAKLIVEAIGTNVDINFVETPATVREESLQNGTVQMIVAAYAITETRKQKVDFAGPYYVVGHDIMVPATTDDIQSVEDLNGKRVCSTQGSRAIDLLREMAPQAQLTEFDALTKCVDAMADGTIDAVSSEDVILLGLIAQYGNRFKLVGNTFTTGSYGIGITKGDDDFRMFINDRLEEIYENGQWADAYERTIGRVAEEVPEPPPVDRS